jgi:hypothetical protein
LRISQEAVALHHRIVDLRIRNADPSHKRLDLPAAEHPNPLPPAPP